MGEPDIMDTRPDQRTFAPEHPSQLYERRENRGRVAVLTLIGVIAAADIGT